MMAALRDGSERELVGYQELVVNKRYQFRMAGTYKVGESAFGLLSFLVDSLVSPDLAAALKNSSWLPRF